MAESDRRAVTPEQHGLGRSVLLHLLPGALITAFIVVAGPLATRLGLPAIFATLTAIPVVLIPFELGYLLHEGRRRHGRPSLSGVVHYRRSTPWWQYALLAPAITLWSVAVLALVSPPVDAWLIDNAFHWMPRFLIDPLDLTGYSAGTLRLTLAAALALNGIAGPLVEELYFRGYLLPRLDRFGVWAPLLNAALFSLYHFFSPWQNPGRILALLPLVYAVWWKRDIRIGILAHVLLNTAAVLSSAPALAG